MTKEKRLIATNKTEEERDRLTEVWKKPIFSMVFPFLPVSRHIVV